jgi:hypothetical protein
MDMQPPLRCRRPGLSATTVGGCGSGAHGQAGTGGTTRAAREACWTRGCPCLEVCMAQSIFDENVRADAIESHGMNPLTEPRRLGRNGVRFADRRRVLKPPGSVSVITCHSRWHWLDRSIHGAAQTPMYRKAALFRIHAVKFRPATSAGNDTCARAQNLSYRQLADDCVHRLAVARRRESHQLVVWVCLILPMQPGLHRQDRRGAVQCLNLRLLVHAQHDRVLLRRQAKPTTWVTFDQPTAGGPAARSDRWGTSVPLSYLSDCSYSRDVTHCVEEKGVSAG